MKYAQIENGVAVVIVESDSPLSGYVQAPAGAGVGWRYDDGRWSPPETPEPPLKARYTHREFILRLGPEYAKIERVRDENNAKPPSKKNYDLARLFRLYDEAEWIGLDDPSLAEAMQAFVGLGLMSEERAAEILTPNEPPQPGDPV